jgi:hypothetical protein
LIDFIGFRDATKSESGLGTQGDGGEFLCPQHHSSDVRIDVLGGEDAADLGLVVGKGAGRLRDAKAEDKAAAAGPGHVVQAGAGAQVMTAAGAPTNSGTLTVAAVGANMATGTNDQGARIHGDLRRVNGSG